MLNPTNLKCYVDQFGLLPVRRQAAHRRKRGIRYCLGLVGMCLVLALLFKPHGGSGWYPFFYDWNGLYQSGVVDAKEWKDNRFRFF